MIDEKKLLDILNNLKDPQTEMSLGEIKAVQNIKLQNNGADIYLQFGYPIAGYQKKLEQHIINTLNAAGFKQINLNLTVKIAAHQVQPGLKILPGIKNAIVIASGKGGVGKSTTAANLALALAADGARVGVLDADIYGPNQPQMLGISGRPKVNKQKKLEPIVAYGLQTMSIGYLVEPNVPVIWRGPMISSALEQLLNDTLWSDLDYLMIDLPPGTGDIQLTLAKKVPLAGAVIITTPQTVALLDTRRGLEALRKLNVKILGVIENMSIFACPACGHQEPVFGEHGGEELAEAGATTLLGQLPLNRQLRVDADAGRPTVVANPSGELAARYQKIARRLAARLALQPKNYGAKFPNVVLEEK